MSLNNVNKQLYNMEKKSNDIHLKYKQANHQGPVVWKLINLIQD